MCNPYYCKREIQDTAMEIWQAAVNAPDEEAQGGLEAVAKQKDRQRVGDDSFWGSGKGQDIFLIDKILAQVPSGIRRSFQVSWDLDSMEASFNSLIVFSANSLMKLTTWSWIHATSDF